jgi:CheY-like chemotaxis protein
MRDFWGSAVARVLLVEDEISLLMLAESVVQGLGHSTFLASNVVQAKTLLDDLDEIDLLFTDVRLPESELGGFEVAQQARTRNPNLKVLYTTAYSLIKGMKGMYVDGGTMLLKPYTAPELARAVVHLLA